MSGEPSCYWPNSYPFNNQRTRGPRYFTASENTTLKLSGWNFGSCFFLVFFWGRQAGGEEAARTKNCQDLIYFMLFQSDRCTFQTPKSFGVPTKKSSPHSFFVLVNPNHPAIGSFHFERYLHMSARRNTQAIAPQAAFRNRLFLGLPLKAQGNPLV